MVFGFFSRESKVVPEVLSNSLTDSMKFISNQVTNLLNELDVLVPLQEPTYVTEEQHQEITDELYHAKQKLRYDITEYRVQRVKWRKVFDQCQESIIRLEKAGKKDLRVKSGREKWTKLRTGVLEKRLRLDTVVAVLHQCFVDINEMYTVSTNEDQLTDTAYLRASMYLGEMDYIYQSELPNLLARIPLPQE